MNKILSQSSYSVCSNERSIDININIKFDSEFGEEFRIDGTNSYLIQTNVYTHNTTITSQ